jgi:hypothetical protein
MLFTTFGAGAVAVTLGARTLAIAGCVATGHGATVIVATAFFAPTAFTTLTTITATITATFTLRTASVCRRIAALGGGGQAGGFLLEISGRQRRQLHPVRRSILGCRDVRPRRSG